MNSSVQLLSGVCLEMSSSSLLVWERLVTVLVFLLCLLRNVRRLIGSGEVLSGEGVYIESEAIDDCDKIKNPEDD